MYCVYIIRHFLKRSFEIKFGAYNIADILIFQQHICIFLDFATYFESVL